MLVVLGDVDAAGVIYFASVYRWHEREFTEWLAGIGVPLQMLLAEGRGLPVRKSDADYLSGASLGDELTVVAEICDVTDTQFVFKTTWRRAGTGRPVAVASTLHVACERDPGTGAFIRVQVWPRLQSALHA